MSQAAKAGVAVATALCSFAGTLLAGVNIGGGLREEYRSNIRRTPDNERQEFVNIPFLQLDYFSRGERFETTVFSRYEYRDYVNDEFTDDGFLTSVSNVDWLITPKNLSWTLSHTHREVTRDAFDPDTPENRQEIDFLSTGPNFDFRLTALQKVRVDLRYGRARYSESNTDHDRIGGELDWFYQRSSVLTYNLSLGAGSTDFEDQEANDNVDRQEIELGARLETARNLFRVTGGYGRAESEARDPVGTALWLGAWTHAFSDALDLNLSAKQELTDAATQIQAEARDDAIGGAFDTIREDSTRSDVFIDTVYSSELSRRSVHGTDRLNAFWRRQNFQRSDRETIRWGVTARYTHAFTPLLRSEYELGYQQAELNDIGREDRTTRVGARLNYQPRPDLRLSLEVLREARDSTEATEEFTDWLGALRVSWRIQQKRRGGR